MNHRRQWRGRQRRIVLTLAASAVLGAVLGAVPGCAPGLTSQNADEALASVASDDSDKYVRGAATERLSDQKALAALATQDGDSGVRREAMNKVTDQVLLAKVATEDKDWWARQDAVEKLTDQAALAKVARQDAERNIRLTAVNRLTDRSLLAELAQEDRFGAIGRIARLRWILTDPVIERRLGKTELSIRRTVTPSQEYRGGGGAVYSRARVSGEAITVTVSGERIPQPCAATWSTTFPTAIDASIDFLPAQVHLPDILGKLLCLFPQLEMAALVADYPDDDLRLCAVRAIADQALLAKLALVDTRQNVRKVAVWKLADPALLAQVAVEAKDWEVRRAAVEKLTDRAVLANVAAEDQDERVREAARRMPSAEVP